MAISLPIISKPGWSPDETETATNQYTSLMWTRFYMGKPKKIGGISIFNDLTNLDSSYPQSNFICRGMYYYECNSYAYDGSGIVVTEKRLWLGSFGNFNKDSTTGSYALVLIKSQSDDFYNNNIIDMTPAINSGPGIQSISRDTQYINVSGNTIVDYSNRVMWTFGEIPIAYDANFSPPQNPPNNMVFLAHLGLGALDINWTYKLGDRGSQQGIIYMNYNNIQQGQLTYVADRMNGDGTNWNPSIADGGFVVVGNILVLLHSDGYISWSGASGLIEGPKEAGHGLQWWHSSNSAQIGNSKFVKGISLLGTDGPAFLAWSLTSLVRGDYSPSLSAATNDAIRNPRFVFRVISDSCSIIAQNSAIEIDNTYFWIGRDCFYTYDGIVRRFDDEGVHEYFFNNLNYEWANVIVCEYLSDFNEIWIHYPSKNPPYPSNTYPKNDSVLIYMRNYGKWVPLNNSDFTFAAQAFAFDYQANLYRALYTPLLLTDDSRTSPIYLCETGTDFVHTAGTAHAINASFGTEYYTWSKNVEKGKEINMRVIGLEIDMKYSGEMGVNIFTKAYANSIPQFTNYPIPAPQPGVNRGTIKLDVREEGRYVAFQFVSNFIEGDFMAGEMKMIIEPGSERPAASGKNILPK